ncbi:MAG: chloride channel protein, partial [Candidatus Nanopelagicales bacterium]
MDTGLGWVALAIGAGMALGREGPTVQMGASVGGGLARYAKLGGHDTRTLAAALAGTGLGVALSAPLGGALCVFEEVARAFRTKLVVTTFVASAVALAVAQWLVGAQPIFLVGVVRPVPAWQLVVFALLGAIFGAIGVGYNWLVLALLRVFDRVGHVAPEAKAAVVGACVGLLGVAAPQLIGGGDALNERVLIESIPIGSLLVIFAVRWVLGPFSYSAGTPGGLFAPLLLVGATAGAL